MLDLPDGYTTDDRFWKKVDKNGPVPSHRLDLGPCWQWTGTTAKDGYGNFGYQQKTDSGVTSHNGAHRYSYTLANGEIPDGLLVCHHCDNPRCVNPTHLFLGTNRDNILDSIKKGRRAHIVLLPHSVPRGESHPRHKLTESAVRQIRQRVMTGETQVSLASEFGVNQTVIGKLIRGEIWRSVI